MEHLIIWLIHTIVKALTQKPKPEAGIRMGSQTPTPSITPNGSPTDVWDDYRRKQAAIERDMAAKSPNASKR